MSTALLSLGSNMGDPARYLAEAVAALGGALVRVSSVYRTPPWGPVAQDDFLNIAALVREEDRDAAGWWQWAQQLERQAQRRREVRWGPRTLDVDIVMVWRGHEVGEGPAGDRPGRADTVPVVSDDPSLTLPHPRAHLRGFVLVPWAEVQPDAELPGRGAIADLLRSLDRSGITKVGGLEL